MTQLEVAVAQLQGRKEASAGESGGGSHSKTAALSLEVTYKITGDDTAGS